jgi:hypothetical protein
MIDAFRIDDQDYVRIGEERLPTSKGRIVKVALWQSNCPDCGATFVQCHRTRAFNPAKRALRRCPGCRKGPGKRVAVSRNRNRTFSRHPAAPILPWKWRPPVPTGNAPLVPGTSGHSDVARPILEPPPPGVNGVEGWALLGQHSPRQTGQSTRRETQWSARTQRANGAACCLAGAFIER